MAEVSSREKFLNLMDKVGEAPLIGLLYESREENINKALGKSIMFSTEKGGIREGQNYEMEGVKDLWRMAGKPKIKTKGVRQPKFVPRDVDYLMREHSGKKQTFWSKWKSKFGKDVVEVRGGVDTGGDLVEELSHAIQWENPEKWTHHSTRKDLFKQKMKEQHRVHAGEDVYLDKTTDEGYTHSIVAPKLYEVMREKGYGVKF
tara:strand:- start:4077 stop:4685 length:609 start_codon:yes stop_codon:yes gene_type:complete